MKKVVIALGGNALLKRGEAFTIENQIKNANIAAASIAKVAELNDVIIVHGNGPQVGLLALQAEAYSDKVPAYPLDVLVAESQGMIGYIMQQALQNYMPHRRIVTIVTQIEVNNNDQAFKELTKPVGPVYYTEAEALAASVGKGWVIVQDGKYFRRAVASPIPQSIVEIEAIRSIISAGVIPIVVGGGGIPVIKQSNIYVGVEAVIDKDLSAALLASLLNVEMFIILSDVEGVYLDWGTASQRLISNITLDELVKYNFASGSMGPKIKAISQFVQQTGKLGAIGRLDHCLEIIQQTKGTIISR